MITISTDKTKLDVSFIQDFLKDIYWAKEGLCLMKCKPLLTVRFVFGIYLNDGQIGFARVVTDYVVFAYLWMFSLHKAHC